MIHSQKKNVAYFNPASFLGGAEISMLELLKRSKNEFNYTVFIPGYGALIDELDAIGIKYEILEWPKRLIHFGEREKKINPLLLPLLSIDTIMFAVKLNLLIKRLNIACLVTNGIKCHIIGAIARHNYNFKIIWYMREIFEDRFLSRKLLSLLKKRVDAVISISDAVKSDISQFIQFKNKVIYNIVDFKKFNPDVIPKNQIIKSKKEIWFCMVGALTPIKGHMLFISAAQNILRSFNNIKFFIIGGNQYHSELDSSYQNQIKEKIHFSSSLREKMFLLGNRTDLPNLLYKMDVVVQPNIGPEGMGRSVIEAMAMGKPVIVVDRWGPAELVVDNMNGFKFRYNDVDELAAKMRIYVENKKIRKLHGTNGLNYVRKKFDSVSIISEYNVFLHEILKSG